MMHWCYIMSDHFRFDLIFIKKITKLNFFKKNQNWFKPVWLDFFYFWLSLARFWLGFFWFWLGFFDLACFFSSFARFFFVWARFGFFLFFAYKTEPVGFFKILISLIGFFLQFGFFGYFFPGFFGFFIFLLTSMLYGINCSYHEHLTWWW
jgi:hypothetical protein